MFFVGFNHGESAQDSFCIV